MLVKTILEKPMREDFFTRPQQTREEKKERKRKANVNREGRGEKEGTEGERGKEGGSLRCQKC